VEARVTSAWYSQLIQHLRRSIEGRIRKVKPGYCARNSSSSSAASGEPVSKTRRVCCAIACANVRQVTASAVFFSQ
jgi:hypothetical protein